MENTKTIYASCISIIFFIMLYMLQRYAHQDVNGEYMSLKKVGLCLIFDGYKISRTTRLKIKAEKINSAIKFIESMFKELHITEESEYLQIPVNENCIYLYLVIPEQAVDQLTSAIIISNEINCKIMKTSPNVIKKYRNIQERKYIASTTFKIGESVTILEGDYEGCDATISRVDAENKTACVQVNIFYNTYYVAKLSFDSLKKNNENQ